MMKPKVLLFTFIARAKVEDWVNSKFDIARPAMVRWVFNVSDWPLAPIILALFLFVAGCILIALIMRALDKGRRATTSGITRECTLHHMNEDERSWLGVFSTQRHQDVENINNFLDTQVQVNFDTIYSKTLPAVTLSVHVRSSSVHSVVVGRMVKGELYEGSLILGDTPKHELDAKGNESVLRLGRGQTGILKLTQVITPDLRERWILNKLGKEITITLERLFLSVDVSDPRNGTTITSTNLNIGPTARTTLYKRWGWSWQDYDEAIRSMPDTEGNP